MTHGSTTEPAQPARPLPQVAFCKLTGSEYPIMPVRVDHSLVLFGWDTTCPTIDLPTVHEVARLLLGEYEDITDRLLTGSDDTGLLIGIVDTTAEQSPRTGQDDWPAADRASDPFYGAASVLIDETVRRHVIGAHRDGIRPAVAARGILRGLIAACHISAAQYLEKPAATG